MDDPTNATNAIINIDLKGLPRVGEVLIQKIAAAVGGMYRPVGTVINAVADAKALEIHAAGAIRVSELQQRAFDRFLHEEAKKQLNIESITQRALPDLRDDAAPESMEDDWVTHFFEQCRIVSDAEMQSLWAKVLAGESNQSGSFSKRSINIIAELSKSDAELFTNLLRFAIGGQDDRMPFVANYDAPIYKQGGLKFADLAHLESLGLILLGGLGGYTRQFTVSTLGVEYFGRSFSIELNGDGKLEAPAGMVMLSRAGAELSRICETEPVDGYFDYLVESFKGMSGVKRVFDID